MALIPARPPEFQREIIFTRRRGGRGEFFGYDGMPRRCGSGPAGIPLELRFSISGQARGMRSAEPRGVCSGELRGVRSGESRGVCSGKSRGVRSGEPRGVCSGEPPVVRSGEPRGVFYGPTAQLIVARGNAPGMLIKNAPSPERAVQNSLLPRRSRPGPTARPQIPGAPTFSTHHCHVQT
jgi:hypothetical protein